MDDPKKKRGAFDAFKISDRTSCEQAIRNGGIAAIVSAVITTGFAVAGFYIQPADGSEYSNYFDPWMLVDVVFLLILAFFVFRKSRVASTVLFVYFVASKISFWAAVGSPKGLPLTLVFFAFYFTAMRATYLWRSTYAQTSPT